MARNASIFGYSIQQGSNTSKFQVSPLVSFSCLVYAISIHCFLMIRNYIQAELVSMMLRWLPEDITVHNEDLEGL